MATFRERADYSANRVFSLYYVYLICSLHYVNVSLLIKFSQKTSVFTLLS